MEQVYDSRAYKVFKTDEGYIYKIYPKNNTNQELGTSKVFDDLKKCKDAYVEFKKYILNNKVDSVENNCISIEKTKSEKDIPKYRYICKINDENIFYQRYVDSMENCKKGVKRLYDALNHIYKCDRKDRTK